jgi:hypothetical protein
MSCFFEKFDEFLWSRGSSVSQSVSQSEFSSGRAGKGIFFSSPPRPDRLWGPPTCLSTGYREDFSSRVKRSGREIDHSPPPGAEVKIAWSYTSTPPYVFMVWYLVKHRDDFTFVHVLWEVLDIRHADLTWPFHYTFMIHVLYNQRTKITCPLTWLPYVVL